MSVVLIDIDDVLADFVGAVRRQCGHRLGELPAPASYAFDDWPKEAQLLARRYIADPQFYLGLDEVPGARMTLRSLAAVTHVAYITARGNGLDQLGQSAIAVATTRWLDQHGFPRARIHYAHGISKGLLARMNYDRIAFAIDDAAHAVESYEEQGIYTCLVDQAHNQDIPDGPLVHRVSDITQAVAHWFGSRHELHAA